MIGIYCYIDTQKDNEIVYIGKDANIHKNARHNAHKSPSRYNEQQINRIIQNNPKRYKYRILKRWESDKYHKNLSNVLEILYIKRYTPQFNYTYGGEGNLGRVISEETKLKISKSKRANLDKISGENNPRYHVNVPNPLDLLKEYEEGDLTQSQLAEKYDCTRGAIYYRIHKAIELKDEPKCFKDRRPAPPIFYGKAHHQYKDTIPEPLHLLQEYNESDMSMVELGKKYGCSTSTIHRRIEKGRKIKEQ